MYADYFPEVSYRSTVNPNYMVGNKPPQSYGANGQVNKSNNNANTDKQKKLTTPFNADVYNAMKYNDGYDMTQNVKLDNNNQYYCGGNSSLALRSVGMNNTSLSDMFFSKENVDRIQKKIKSAVKTMSNGKFRMDVDQDELELNLAMRAVFLDYGKNLPNHLVRQVKVLNQQVLDYIMPEVMTNVNQYYGYLKDISQPYKTLPRPMNVNNAGTKTLPSMTSRWGF